VAVAAVVADLNVVASQLLDCVCAALEEAERPACNCYPTIGPPLVGPCCECEDGSGITGDLTINFETMYPADVRTLDRVTQVYPCRQRAVAADFTIVLTRCYPTVTKTADGIELPTIEDQEQAAEDLGRDLNIVWQALTCCPGMSMRWRDLAVDSDPEGGCSMLAARITVDVSGG